MNTLYDGDRFSLIHGEALSTMRHLPSKSCGLVLTDPPYSPHVHDKLGKERRSDGVAPRSKLGFPPLNPAMIEAVAGEFVRLCTGWILIFSDNYSSSVWGNAVIAAGGAWVRTGHWVKTSPMPQMSGDRPACGAEDIVICHASADSKNWDWNGRGHAAIWRGNRDRPNLHPNQKPLWLMQSLLGMFAPAGALVLDPFFGTGSTAVAATLPYRAIGESDVATACEKCSKRRVEEYAPPLPVDVRVIGIEGDIDIAVKAAERVNAARG